MSSIIVTDNISKSYGETKAVKNVSIEVAQGEIYGFLGLNGAGKTTLIRMLLGMIKPNGGAAYISGKQVNAGNYKVWEDVGYMVELPYSYPELTVFENLEIVRKMRKIIDKTATEKIIDKLALGAHRNKKTKALSLGNGQRLGIAKAMIHSPKLLILDEPTNGLDPAGIVEVRNLLKNLAENQGVTILISSHLLGEISKTANRIGIIHQGSIITEMNAAEFEKTRRKSLIVNTRNNDKACEVLRQDGYNIENSKEYISCFDEKAVAEPDLIAEKLTISGVSPKQLQVYSEDLEAYFLRIIGEKEVV